MSELGEAAARGVTRSMAAQSAEATATVVRRRRAQPNGWWGMVLFLCAEATLFGTLLATYFYLDFDSAQWPPPGIKPPDIVLPLLATSVLVTTSIPMALASRFARSGKRLPTIWLLVLGLVVQGCYLAAQILLFRHDLLQFRPNGSAYGSIYFTMLAAHHAHVVLGLLLDVAVLWHLSVRGLTNYWVIGVRGVALYWHVVNALAVLVVLTQLSPSL